MKTQDYKNHLRFYAPHHYVFYPVMTLLIALSTWHAFKEDELSLIWLAIATAFLMITLLSLMLRQHYALGNQNRIVRLEMRLRYYQLTHQPFEPIELKLSFGQIAALRFASNEELLALIEKTVAEQLSPSIIKKSIQQWVPDHMRV